MKRKTKQSKPFWKMNADELAEATKEFDKEIPAEKLRPLNKAERERWERSKRQPSRSIYVFEKSDKGVEAVVLELDSKLLRKLDAYASTHQMTRAQLIEKSLRSILSFVDGLPTPKASRRSA